MRVNSLHDFIDECHWRRDGHHAEMAQAPNHALLARDLSTALGARSEVRVNHARGIPSQLPSGEPRQVGGETITHHDFLLRIGTTMPSAASR